MKGFIPSLNGLRALSIFMVIALHFNMHHFFPEHGIVHHFNSLVINGTLGVNIFFTISGFLITTLLMREQERTGDISLKGFYYRRVIRIFPAYYFLLLVYFVLQLCSYFKLSQLDWLSSLTYTKQFFTETSFETAHLWSLSVEEIFYFVWPLVFLKYGRRSLPFIYVCIFLVSVTRLLCFQFPLPKLASTIFTTGDSLLIGCLFAIQYDKIKSWIVRHPNASLLVFPLLFISVTGYNYLYHLSPLPMSPQKSYWVNAILLPIFYGFFGQIGSVTTLLIGVLIIYSINVKGVWFNFLNHSIMNYLGILSYSLYLWQQLFTADRPYLHRIPVPVILCFILAAACLSHYVIEKPFLKLKNVKWHKASPEKVNVN